MMQRLFFIFLASVLFTSVAKAQDSAQADSLTLALQEVVVTSRQPATKLVGTTLVSTIPGSSLEGLGSALDVLAQLPMITVADDAVTVTGKGAPEIYIDGRPLRSDDELTRLQSNNIRKVELVMAPGAMYESTVGAVLKITTRQRFVDGLSLLDRAEVTARRRWSANELLDLNYRRGAWDIFASGMVARNNSLIKGSTTNTLMWNGRETVVGSSQHKEFPSTNGVVKAGFNYARGEQSFGGYYRFTPERGSFSNAGTEWLDDEPAVTRDISTATRGRSHHAQVYYDNTPGGGTYHLHFDGDYRNSRSSNDVRTTYPAGERADVNSADSRRSTLWAGKLYLSMPLCGGQLTAGTQDSHTRTTLDYRMLNEEVGDYIPSTLTDARQTSLAAFATWDRSFGPLSLSAGVRYEHVDYRFKVNGVKDRDVSRTDDLVTPDVTVGYTFSDESQVSLSYRMSTVKPPYSQLTGSLSYVGMHEIEGGNPALKDERMHDLQLFGMWKGFLLQADYTRSRDTYAFVKRLYNAPTLQLIMQPVNIDVSALDVYLVWSRRVVCWTPNVTLGMHRQWLEMDGTRYNRPIFSYYLDNTVSLPQGFLLTVNAGGQTSGDMHTNRFGATWFALDASVSRSFLNKSLQVKLSATDLLNTRNNDWTMNTCGVTVDKRQTYDRRGVSLSLTYRFQPRQPKYKGQPAARSELDRL